jgi:hypothetical protein
VDLVAGAVDASAVPLYSNYQGKLVYDLSPRHQVTLVSLGGRETLDVRVKDQDEDDPNTLDADQAGWRAITGLGWRFQLGARAMGRLTVSHAVGRFATDAWDTALDGQLVVHNRSRESDTTAKGEVTFAGRLGTLQAGGSLKRLATSLDRRHPLGQQDPYSSDPARVNAFAVDREISFWPAAAHVQVSRDVTSRTTLTLGGRYSRLAPGRAELTPRAGLRVRPRPNLDLGLSVGRYAQMPSLVVLGSHAANSGLLPIRADHAVASLAWFPRGDVKVTVEAFGKRYDRYPVARDFPAVSLANLGDQFDTGLFLAPMESGGAGRAHGIEAYVQKRMGRRVYGQASYSWSRTQHRARDGVWRFGAFDLRHAATVLGGLRLRPSLEASFRFTATSGRPFTPLLEAESAAQNREVYDLGRLGEGRTPAYHRLDLRLDRRFAFSWGHLVVYAEVENVWDRENVRAYVWNPLTRTREASPQAGRLAIAGLNLEF